MVILEPTLQRTGASCIISPTDFRDKRPFSLVLKLRALLPKIIPAEAIKIGHGHITLR